MAPKPAPGPDLPGKLEQQVLMALAACADESPGGSVYDQLLELCADTARPPSLPAVYITLDRLRQKGLVVARTADPEPGRGGKPRKFYSLSQPGADLLHTLRSQFDRLWGAAARHPLLAGIPTGHE